MVVEILGPGLPAQAPPDPGVGRGASLGVFAVDLHVAEFSVRDESTVDEESRTDSGPERQHDHDTALAVAGAEAHLGDPGRIGVVDQPGPSFEGLGEGCLGLEADPLRIDVGGGLGHAVEDDRRKADPDRLDPRRRLAGRGGGSIGSPDQPADDPSG